MGPIYWQPQADTHLQKCSETKLDSCGGNSTAECCAVVLCNLCLRLEIYGEDDELGTATLNKESGIWVGSVGGFDFEAWWEKNLYSDQCEFIVEFNGVEVYRKSCYEGQSCRDSSDSAGVTIGYDEGTLTWSKLEPRTLPYVVPEGECRTWFCGDCECTCECLCVTITSPDSVICKGEACVGSYDDTCVGPVWSTEIECDGETYDISIALGRNEYGQCILYGTSGYDDLEEIVVSDCQSLAASWQIGYATIEVKCKGCECEKESLTGCCVEKRSCNVGDPPIKLMIQLTAYYPSNPPIAQSDCFSATFPLEEGLTCVDVSGTGAGTPGSWGTATQGVYGHACSWCGFNYKTAFTVALTCGDGTPGEDGGPRPWLLHFNNTQQDIGQTCNFHPNDNQPTYLRALSCDPILLSGDFSPCLDYPNDMCIIRCINGDYSLHAPVCLHILVYEVP